ncbi:unnamed protein product [Mytilus coruscus]|uniref:Tesmin/TSO1-like CXC domain-containing protein n=1 Tax=Mytilus coruscus TaxID=42192 RepID=A0A6J7ZUT7_MYTCO|nr:unnamed protein product [Mytilus coruscus]
MSSDGSNLHQMFRPCTITFSGWRVSRGGQTSTHQHSASSSDHLGVAITSKMNALLLPLAVLLRKFLNKVSTGTACVQVYTLPPTSDAARFHSLRVYLQSQTWIDKSDDLNAQEYGWFISDNKLLPTKSVLPPAPEVLLNIIRCNCKQNCDSKRCTCRKHGLDCSISYGECRGVNCSNSPSVTDEDPNDEI